MKILAFAASSSQKSINKRLAGYVAGLVPNASVDLIDLNDYEMPLFSEDKEKQIGKPEAVDRFLSKIKQADLLVISLAEHNGSYTAAYKNIFDWCSRTAKKVYENKRVILLSASPGPGGAKSVLEMAVKSMPFFGAVVLGSLSVPKFQESFDQNTLQPRQEDLKQRLSELITTIK